MAKAENSSSEQTKKVKKSPGKIKNSYLLIALALLLVAGAGAAGYKMVDDSKKEAAKLREENKKLADPQESARVETQRVKEQVSKLIDVPQNEDPTIASVVDASKLSEQAFFKNAKNGDKVLMYAQAKKAILYRPDTNKIIEVAPINIGNNQQPAAPAGTE